VRSADAVITVSEDLRAHAIDAGAAPERVHTVLNGIEPSLFFLRDRAAVRPLLGLAGDRRLIAFVGRLSAAKGIAELLAACDRLFDRLPDVDLAVIGSGRMGDKVNEFAARYPQRVRIMNSCTRSEVGQWIAAADVFALPSYSEGCPNVVIEALASGRPVVATNVGGIPELITPSNGILVEPKDVEGLDRALEDALNRHWDHAAISAAWQRNWTDVAAETLRVCAELLGQEPRSPEHNGGVRPEAVV
jgi:glycosyltransferase involved in cell wall biosynthesis